MARRVIVTRPEPQASAWVEALLARGIDSVALPLLAIAAPPDPATVKAAAASLPSRDLVVFVSPNAAHLFFQTSAPRSEAGQAAWPGGLLAGSTGPGTSAALRSHGVPAACIVEPAPDSAQFDSESLWRALEPVGPATSGGWRNANVLVVRGEGGRDWLADTLRAHGASVEHVAAYSRRAPSTTSRTGSTLAAALAAPSAHVWLFSSSAGIDHLAGRSAGHDWHEAIAIASHPRIAERARLLGVGRVIEARPGLEAAVACLQSIAP